MISRVKVGTYEADFDSAAGAWGKGNTKGDGLELRLGFGPVRNTIRAWVNGCQLPPLDLTDAVADVNQFLVNGSNGVRVEVTSLLFNAVKARTCRPGALKSESLGPRNPDLIIGPDFDEFGLVGMVMGEVRRRATEL